jgi:hypothetical protein
MDLTTFLVTVFCLIDDWLVAQEQRLRQRGPRPTLADSELLTIECVGEFLGIDTDSGLSSYFRRHWADWFAALNTSGCSWASSLLASWAAVILGASSIVGSPSSLCGNRPTILDAAMAELTSATRRCYTARDSTRTTSSPQRLAGAVGSGRLAVCSLRLGRRSAMLRRAAGDATVTSSSHTAAPFLIPMPGYSSRVRWSVICRLVSRPATRPRT